MWGFTEEERRVLAPSVGELPGLRAVLERAVPRPALAEGLLLVQVTAVELDEMYSLVEALMEGTRSRRRLEILDGLLASLCSSIDGF